MNPYAVIETGGKQYRVEAGTVLDVERLTAKEGDTLRLAPVLARSDGTALAIGTPCLDAAAVTAVVIRHRRGKKVISFKRRRRKGYERKLGHRQELTVLRIDSLT